MDQKHIYYDDDIRVAQRFQFGWRVAVAGTDHSGTDFNVEGALENVSSKGALLNIPQGLSLGDRLELVIQLPIKRKCWMKYPAKVIRLDKQKLPLGVAVIFDTVIPCFVAG